MPARRATAEPTTRAPSSIWDRWQRHDRLVFAAFAMSCAIYAASNLQGQILAQTGGIWIAPRDDLYFHFAHARALAEGRPFAWSVGAGYGSGDPSVAYVGVLALGQLLGFQQLRLALWAALVGCATLVVTLVAIGRLLETPAPPGRWSRFLIPPVVLAVGAILEGLSLGSGGLLMAAWALALLAAVRLRETGLGAGWLGLAATVAVATRWEALAPMLVVGLWATRRPRALLRGLGPPGALVGVLLLLNVALTREIWPSSLIADSPWFEPHATTGLVARWAAGLGQVVSELSLALGGALPWWLGAASLAFVPGPTRATSAVVFVSALVWLAVVAATHPVGAEGVPTAFWVLVLASRGLAVLASRSDATGWNARSWYARAAVVAGVLGIHAATQLPRTQAAIWELAHEARRIRDEDVTLGLAVGEMPVGRLLVAEAGALTYVADRPAIDLEGRGGFRGLPFARAARLGSGASLELIERIPVGERPDAFLGGNAAIDALPVPFGEHLTQLRTPRGSLPLLEAWWEALDRRGAPRTLAEGERVIAAIDLADLVSEDAADLTLSPPYGGEVRVALLAEPRAPDRDLFDAGRMLLPGHRISATLEGNGHHLLVRLAPTHSAALSLRLDEVPLATVPVEPTLGAWQEVPVPLPAGPSERRLHLEADGELVVYHLWVVGR